MSSFYKAPTDNFVQTTLNGAISDSANSITLTDASKLQYPGYVVIDRLDGLGTSTPSAREVVRYTGISGNNLTGCTRGADNTTAQSHSDGARVETMLFVGMWNDLVAILSTALDTTGSGILLSTATITQMLNVSGASVLGLNESKIFLSDTTVLDVSTAKHGFVPKAPNDTDKFLRGDATWSYPLISSARFAPSGFLVNGKISVTVASNNITVALKGMDGNDPSASNPVYIRIDSTVRTITSALSVTKNAGTNWFNSGSSELATKEVDYFVYVGYNATDGVTLGFSRIPYARTYTDFSTTTTNERYCAISTITTAASTDSYVVIGRFGATLSAGAGYTWSVPTFTGSNLVQRPIFTTRALDFVPTYTGSGSMTISGGDLFNAKYTINDKLIYVDVRKDFTTGGTASNTILSTLPMAPLYGITGCPNLFNGYAYQGGSIQVLCVFDGTKVNMQKVGSANFALSATEANFTGVYSI